MKPRDGWAGLADVDWRRFDSASSAVMWVVVRLIGYAFVITWLGMVATFVYLIWAMWPLRLPVYLAAPIKLLASVFTLILLGPLLDIIQSAKPSEDSEHSDGPSWDG